MKRAFITATPLFLGGIFCVAALCQTEGGGKRERADTRDGLQLSVALDTKGCRFTDTVVFKLKLKNVGRVPISLYEQLVSAGGGGYRVEVTDESGKFALGSMNISLANAVHWPTFDEERRVTIRPGESVEWAEEYELRNYAAMGMVPPLKEPGAYRLSVLMYQCPVVGGLKDKDWALESKPVSFEVCR